MLSPFFHVVQGHFGKIQLDELTGHFGSELAEMIALQNGLYADSITNFASLGCSVAGRLHGRAHRYAHG